MIIEFVETQHNYGFDFFNKSEEKSLCTKICLKVFSFREINFYDCDAENQCTRIPKDENN